MNADTKTLEQRARELLAHEHHKEGDYEFAYGIVNADELGWSEQRAVNAIIAAISSAAEAKGVEYDRSVLYDMLGDYAGYHEVADCLPPDFSAEAIEHQRKMLRAADEADAAGVRTVCRPAVSAVPDYALLQRYVRNIHVPVMYMGKSCIQRESVIKAVDRWIASAPSPETEGKT